MNSGVLYNAWSMTKKVPKFTGSNPAEAVRIFKGEKSSARLTSEGKWSSLDVAWKMSKT
jgi:hypothetical protein